jgi:hypothetical protein
MGQEEGTLCNGKMVSFQAVIEKQLPQSAHEVFVIERLMNYLRTLIECTPSFNVITKS